MKKAFSTLMIVSIITACAPATAVDPFATPVPATSSAPTALSTSETDREIGEPLLVAFVKNDDIYLWDSETGESEIIVKAGDVTHVTISDDGQVIAFQRRTVLDRPELVEYSALWAVDRDGSHPRELVSVDSLRQRLNPADSDSTGSAGIEWIPGAHRLVYTGLKYFAPGQGSTHSKDIFVVDADTGTDTVLAADVMPDAFVNDWRFVLSPDGQRIALFSATELSFINVDGSNWRRAVLTYPVVGMGDAVLLSRGVWTQDSSAFLFTGPTESTSPFVLNYTIWRVPADGSPPEALTALKDSHSSYMTFSPDGQLMTFFQDINGDGTIHPEDHQIMPLPGSVGPLARPSRSDQSYVLWSPGGEAFVIQDLALFRLCPQAKNASEVCGEPIPLARGGDLIDGFEWVDEERFLYRVVEPSRLFLGKLDGTILPIVTTTEGESFDGWSFYAP